MRGYKPKKNVLRFKKPNRNGSWVFASRIRPPISLAPMNRQIWIMTKAPSQRYEWGIRVTIQVDSFLFLSVFRPGSWLLDSKGFFIRSGLIFMVSSFGGGSGDDTIEHFLDLSLFH